jgi:tetratricopeptide (TPR) repeat protein
VERLRADLDEPVRIGAEAVAAGPDKAPPWTNLGLSLRTRFSRTGKLSDVDKAVDAYRKALAAMPADDPDRWIVLSGLATALRARFERTGELADLDAAIQACHEGTDATSDENAEQAEMCSTLANVAYTRFTHTRARADLDAAIAAGTEATAATADDHPDRTRYLSNLAVALLSRYRLASDPADLDAALTAAEQAVATTDEGHHTRAANLSNLAIMLEERYKHTGRPEDLDAAVDAIERAVDATPTAIRTGPGCSETSPTSAGPATNTGGTRLTWTRRWTRAGRAPACRAPLPGTGDQLENHSYLVMEVVAERNRDDWYTIPELATAYETIRSEYRRGPGDDFDAAVATFRSTALTCNDLLLDDAMTFVERVNAQPDQIGPPRPRTRTTGEAPDLPPLKSIHLSP